LGEHYAGDLVRRGMEEKMTRFFAGVLSVIAVGILLVAYGLLRPGAAAFGQPYAMDQFGRPIITGGQIGQLAPVYGQAPIYGQTPAYGQVAPAYGQVAPVSRQAMPVNVVSADSGADMRVVPAVTTVQPRVVAAAPKRNWKKTALVIGGSTATGAGIGGLVAGKKGALIGAAIGGGASTIYESTK
jgi:hypothetical protein